MEINLTQMKNLPAIHYKSILAYAKELYDLQAKGETPTISQKAVRNKLSQ